MTTFRTTDSVDSGDQALPRVAVALDEQPCVTLPPHIECAIGDAPDAIVAFTSDPQFVAALALQARGRLLVVMPPSAPAEAVGAALDAGADACVRGFDARLVAAHLTALLRRARYA